MCEADCSISNANCPPPHIPAASGKGNCRERKHAGKGDTDRESEIFEPGHDRLPWKAETPVPDLEQEPCQPAGMADFRRFLHFRSIRGGRRPCPLPDRIGACADETEQRWHGN
jgi:hypothetical protein